MVFDTREYLNVQMQEIMIYKWIESEKEGYDIGTNRAVFEWIVKYSDSYREYWKKKKNM